VALGLVVAEFNDVLTQQMEASARETAADHDIAIAETIRVPGAYDTVLAADRLARQTEIDAVAVLGAIVTGDTAHDEVIADAAAQGLTDVSIERDTPVTLGITGPDMSAEEARERTNYGRRAVESAIQLRENL